MWRCYFNDIMSYYLFNHVSFVWHLSFKNLIRRVRNKIKNRKIKFIFIRRRVRMKNLFLDTNQMEGLACRSWGDAICGERKDLEWLKLAIATVRIDKHKIWYIKREHQLFYIESRFHIKPITYKCVDNTIWLSSWSITKRY